jgi:hypothetical protein
MDSEYSVKWEMSALRQLGQLYNIGYEKVYRTSKMVLSRNPLGQSYGSADYPDFEYNCYHLSYIHNFL